MSIRSMLPSRKLPLITLSVVFAFLVSGNVGAEDVPTGPSDGTFSEEAENGYYITRDTTWKKTDTLVFDKPVYVSGGESPVTLTIEPGAQVHIDGDSLMVQSGTVDASGTDAEPVTFLSDGDKPFVISFQGNPEDGQSVLSHVRIRNGGFFRDPDSCHFLSRRNRIFPIETAFAGNCPSGSPAVEFISGNVRIGYAEFVGSRYADIVVRRFIYDTEYRSANSLLVEHSSLADSARDTAFQLETVCGSDIDPVFCSMRGKDEIRLHDNWYGSSDGPNTSEHPDSTGKKVMGEVMLDSWLTADPFAPCADGCASNVLFLPGIKASRLYMKTGSGKENRLWPPDFFSDDVTGLALDADGKSVNDVYTKDVLESAGIDTYYKSFLADLEREKSDKIIADYVPFAYDWRMNVEDIANGDTPYPDGSRSPVDTLESLAKTSKSSKVTIVAHSNGGLLAKALLTRLKDKQRTDLVDQVVFVGTPQMGAPISMLSLLYGYGEDLLRGVLASRADIRSLAENMPGAYGLLPSSEYFRRSDDPLVSFSSEHTRFKAFRDAYGGTVGDREELAEFLSAAKDGRDRPEADDVESENILRKNLLDEADATSGRLDGWTPPDGVKVVQIAGWGLDTIRGVDYAEKEAAKCHSTGLTFIPTCTGIGTYEPIYEPEFTVDGDEVVTAPSALMLSEASNVKRYWVDLWSYGKNHVFGNNHANLLEIRSLRDFVLSIIAHTESDSSLPDYINTSRPSDYEHAKPRIRMSLYSPLDISLTDSAGNHTGPKEIISDGVASTIVEEGIPGSSYYRFGDRKYVSFPEGEPIGVRLDGYDDGSYTLKLEEVAVTKEGEETLSHTTFENLPVNAATTVTLSVPGEGLAKLSALQADMNGDEPGGEYTVIPVANGTATFDATQSGVAPERRDEESVVSGTTTNDNARHGRPGEPSSKRSVSKKKYEVRGVTVGWKGRLLSAGLPSVSSAQATIGETEVATPAVLGAETRAAENADSINESVSRVSSMLRSGIRFLFSGSFLSRDVLSFLWKSGISDWIRWTWQISRAPFFGTE